MGIKDRKARIQEATRIGIMQAALDIVKEQGVDSLSMRKIADRIEYSATIIYSHFRDKDDLLAAISQAGLNRLTKLMSDAIHIASTPLIQLQEAWLAYWSFAFSEKELYQMMFGVGTACNVSKDKITTTNGPLTITRSVLCQLLTPLQADNIQITNRSYMLWSLVHGLAAISITQNNASFQSSSQIIKDAILVLSSP